MMGEGIVMTVGRESFAVVETSEDDRSGRTSSLMRSSSTLRLICRSSSLSASGSPSNASPCRLRRLPLMVRRFVLPVEFARRERVLRPGEEFGELLASSRAGEESAVKLVLRGIRSMPLRSSRGIVRRFSSMIDTGDVERGDSRKDMDTARMLGGRMLAEVS